jgi:hypothetical protein
MLASLLKRLPVVKHEYRSYNDYWRLLRELALMGYSFAAQSYYHYQTHRSLPMLLGAGNSHEERTWMLRYDVITPLCNFYCDPEPLKNFNHRPGSLPSLSLTHVIMSSNHLTHVTYIHIQDGIPSQRDA